MVTKKEPAESTQTTKSPQQTSATKQTAKGMVKVTLLKGGWLRHPSGIRLVQGEPVQVPDDSWTDSQIQAKLMSKGK